MANPDILENSERDQANAWLITLANRQRIALPWLSCQEVLRAPSIIPVPGQPGFSHGICFWHGQCVPVLDFHALFSATSVLKMPAYALIISFENNHQVAYGALGLSELPELIRTDDTNFCSLPANRARWAMFVNSCFRYQQMPIPVIDPQKIFLPRRA